MSLMQILIAKILFAFFLILFLFLFFILALIISKSF